MKKSLLFVLLVIVGSQLCVAQNPGEWMWIHGDTIPNSPAVYGTQGVPAPANTPAGVYEACPWTDLSGNFWIFSGGGGGGSDFWKYNPSTNEWTFMDSRAANWGIQGVTVASNYPPAKTLAAASWTDLNGNLWLFGGGGGYNDLWKYDPSTNLWTWMKGTQTLGDPGVYGIQGVSAPANCPPARYECTATWVDNNNLWLFGGFRSNSSFNDLWRYNIATNEWTWMKGSSTANAPGVYGILGVEDPLNTPGARLAYTSWKDNCGNFWLFSGMYYGAKTMLSDVWRYNPATNNWACMYGTAASVTQANFGTKCQASPTNQPSGRYESRARWNDSDGNLYVYGGAHYPGSPHLGDLWKYCLKTNSWVWISGDSAISAAASWGTKGISSPINKPGGRMGSSGFTDGKGHLYLFAAELNPYRSDLWKYTLDSSCAPCAPICNNILPLPVFTSSDTVFCDEGGQCIDFLDHTLNNPTSWQWYFPGAVPDTSSLQNPTNICYSTPGTYAVTLVVSNSNGSDSITVSPMITFATAAPKPVLAFSGDTIFCSHAAAYQWYLDGLPISGATDSFYVAPSDGVYAVLITDNNGCLRLSNGFPVLVNEVGGVNGVRIYPNPAGDQFMIYDSRFMFGKNAMVEIYNVLGEKVLQSEINPDNIGTKTEIDISYLRKGIYFVRINGRAGALRLVKID